MSASLRQPVYEKDTKSYYPNDGSNTHMKMGTLEEYQEANAVHYFTGNDSDETGDYIVPIEIIENTTAKRRN